MFEVFPSETSNNSELNSGVYDGSKIEVSFWIDTFQPTNPVQRIHFEFSFSDDSAMSGTVDNLYLKVETKDGKRLFEVGEIDPDELYWAGCAMKRIAEHFGCTRESMEKAFEEKHKD